MATLQPTLTTRYASTFLRHSTPVSYDSDIIASKSEAAWLSVRTGLPRAVVEARHIDPAVLSIALCIPKERVPAVLKARGLMATAQMNPATVATPSAVEAAVQQAYAQAATSPAGIALRAVATAHGVDHQTIHTEAVEHAPADLHVHGDWLIHVATWQALIDGISDAARHVSVPTPVSTLLLPWSHLWHDEVLKAAWALVVPDLPGKLLAATHPLAAAAAAVVIAQPGSAQATETEPLCSKDRVYVPHVYERQTQDTLERVLHTHGWLEHAALARVGLPPDAPSQWLVANGAHQLSSGWLSAESASAATAQAVQLVQERHWVVAADVLRSVPGPDTAFLLQQAAGTWLPVAQHTPAMHVWEQLGFIPAEHGEAVLSGKAKRELTKRRRAAAAAMAATARGNAIQIAFDMWCSPEVCRAVLRGLARWALVQAANALHRAARRTLAGHSLGAPELRAGSSVSTLSGSSFELVGELGTHAAEQQRAAGFTHPLPPAFDWYPACPIAHADGLRDLIQGWLQGRSSGLSMPTELEACVLPLLPAPLRAFCAAGDCCPMPTTPPGVLAVANFTVPARDPGSPAGPPPGMVLVHHAASALDISPELLPAPLSPIAAIHYGEHNSARAVSVADAAEHALAALQRANTQWLPDVANAASLLRGSASPTDSIAAAVLCAVEPSIPGMLLAVQHAVWHDLRVVASVWQHAQSAASPC